MTAEVQLPNKKKYSLVVSLKELGAKPIFFLIRAVGLWVLRPLLA
jgi:hypothetical protein